MGRPALLTKERARRILKALKLGATRTGAANCAGVGARTLFDWIRRGRKGEQPYAELAEAIEQQQQAFEVVHLERIEKASKRNWTASAWMLERRLPKHYARRSDDETINRKVEERLQGVLKHAEEEWRRRLAAGNQQRLLEGKDDEGNRQEAGADGRSGLNGGSGVDSGSKP